MTKTTETLSFYTDKDDYGRTCYRTTSRRGVIVKMPRTYTATRPEEKFLVNLHLPLPADPTYGVTYWPTLAEAKAFFTANATAR